MNMQSILQSVIHRANGPRGGGGALAPGDVRALRCHGCHATWPVEGGIPHLYREEEVVGIDRFMRSLYDTFPSWHDPLTAALAPLLQATTERRGRERYMRRLELGSIAPQPGEPIRILDVGVGSGANLPYLRQGLPRGVPVEIWGIDLSRGMLAICQRRVRDGSAPEVRLLLADAHALPFPDGMFDRVVNVGGIGGFRDPARALREMARVARPGTPIVVVDEQLDPERRHGLVHRGAFRAITFYDQNPHCPREHLPPGATQIHEEQISRYYYCLTFSMPAAGGAS
jgi:ubiquinone/menaquinone biosynthesis C-methylase UbiE